MRVLNVNKFHYRRAGAEKVYFDTARLLQEHGHEVVPFAMQHPQNEPTPWSRFFPPYVEFRAPGSPLDRLGRARRVLYSRAARDGLRRLLAETQPDLAHLHNIAHQLSPSILDALAEAGVPVVQTLHDYKLTCPVYTHRTGGAICERCRGGRYYQCLLHRCNAGSLSMSFVNAAEMTWHQWRGSYDTVDLFVCPSTFLMAKCLEHGITAERLHFVPHFVYATDFPAAGSPGETVLYAGRLAEEKGLLTLLEAVAHAPGLQLHIAGDGPRRGHLERHARNLRLGERVRFLGHLTGPSYDRAWQEAGLLVVPSEWWEVRPMVIHEAYARGRAVVASRCGTIPEIVREGETGALFRSGDAEDLAHVLESALGDRDRLRAWGEAARRYVEEELTPEHHYEALSAAYEAARARREVRA